MIGLDGIVANSLANVLLGSGFESQSWLLGTMIVIDRHRR